MASTRQDAVEDLRSIVRDAAAASRILPEQIAFNESAVLGRGAYGTVVEAQLVAGPWAGLRIVAKRAIDKHDPPCPPSEDARIFAPALAPVQGEQDAEELRRAAAYLDVEATVNTMVAAACPAVAAPYLGDCVVGGRRWLLWQREGTLTLEDLLADADWVGTPGPLAEALGVDPAGDGAAQRVAVAVARQLLAACQALRDAGLCELPE